MPSEIANFDARIDWSLSETDLISLSVFGKDIEKPIQAIRANRELNKALQQDGVSWSTDGNTNTFVNSESATVYGVELEGKVGLETFSEYFQGFRIGGNLTWSSSEVSLSDAEKASIHYNKPDRMKRSLEGQSEWIYTVDLSYANEDWGTSEHARLQLLRFEVAMQPFQPAPMTFGKTPTRRLILFIHINLVPNKIGKLKISAKNLTAEDRIVRVRGYDAIEEKYSTPRAVIWLIFGAEVLVL